MTDLKENEMTDLKENEMIRMGNYDLTLKKEVTREFAREVMGRISKSNKVFK